MFNRGVVSSVASGKAPSHMAGLMEVIAVNFSVLPPEINSLRMFLGAGSAPMLEASVAWSGLAEELGSAADSFSSVTTNLAGQAWQGPAAQAMARAARPYADFLRAASVRATTASSGAKSVASIFEAAKAATVHPDVITANRQAFVQAVRTNIFGFNAPFIAAAEAAYEEFWATDVAAMVGYHGGASTVAAQLSSWAQTVQNLPGLGQLLGGTPAAAAGDPNIGLGNKGGGNIGNGNNNTGTTGGFNVGNGNTGSGNFGSGNNGTSNIGAGNKGTSNFGLGNNGFNNFGLGNAGGTTSTRGSVGVGNLGNNNFGLANTGNNNIGGGNTGNDNIGFGLTGNKLVGVGGAYYDTVAGAFHFDNPFANGNIGFGNSGHGNIGFFNSGDGNLGIFNSGANTDVTKLGHLQGLGIGNSGFGNIGFGNTGDGNFGTGNSGFLNTGFGNSGDMNTGGGNSGGSIASLLGVNPQPGNTGFGNSGFGNTGFGNAGNLNTGFFNGGNVNTGLFNSGNVNTGFNISTDSGLTHSGFNTVGTNVSGFNNSATGAVGAVPPATLNGNISGFGNTAIGANNPVGASVAGGMSGFFNTASGASNPAAGLILNGLISGFANRGVTAALLGILPSGVVSGVGSGLLNANTGFSAVFNIQKALAG